MRTLHPDLKRLLNVFGVEPDEEDHARQHKAGPEHTISRIAP